MGVAAAIAGGTALASTGASIYGAQKASKAQRAAAVAAAQTQEKYYGLARDNLAPFINMGLSTQNMLLGDQGLNVGGSMEDSPLLRRFNPTLAELEQTPGYQFTRDQGLKAAQNGFAARGLGSSGAAMKGGIDYATGLAETTFDQNFKREMTQREAIYNMLFQPMQTGAQAANSLAGFGQGTGSNIASIQGGVGNAQAASAMSQANAIGQLPLTFASNYMLADGMVPKSGGMNPLTAGDTMSLKQNPFVMRTPTYQGTTNSYFRPQG
jgi:hypothetical protein